MAKYYSNDDHAVDMRLMNYASIFFGDKIITRDDLISIRFNAGNHIDIEGSGFTYDNHGLPTGGIIDSIVGYHFKEDLGGFRGIHLKMVDLIDVIQTKSVKDDLELYARMLSGDDDISGTVKSDWLVGKGGDDTIEGKGGADRLISGIGNDTFVFRSTFASNASNYDTIMDFDHGRDEIDLGRIDANGSAKGDGEFRLVGRDSFSGDRAELIITHKDGDTFIFGDVDGDREADLAIRLHGRINIQEQDFTL